jgi:SAM-dependent methyltransferase
MPDLGALRRLTPVDDGFGAGRGRPIDRHYIEAFLERHAADVRGRVLEVADDRYTRRYGDARVTRSAILHVDATSNPQATLVGDLARPDSLPEAAFDCFVCTQTLQYVHDPRAAAVSLRRLLAPGGVLLLTVPGISQISPYDRDRWGEHWRFMPQAVERLLGEVFDSVEVASWGNVLTSIGFLHGLCCDDLTVAELDHFDDRYPLVVTARAVRA